MESLIPFLADIGKKIENLMHEIFDKLPIIEYNNKDRNQKEPML